MFIYGLRVDAFSVFLLVYFLLQRMMERCSFLIYVENFNSTSSFLRVSYNNSSVYFFWDSNYNFNWRFLSTSISRSYSNNLYEWGKSLKPFRFSDWMYL